MQQVALQSLANKIAVFLYLALAEIRKEDWDEELKHKEVEEQQQEVSDDDPESELGVAPPRLDACTRTCHSLEALGV